MENFSYIFSDKFWFLAFQVSVCALGFFSLFRKSLPITGELKRGEASKQYLHKTTSYIVGIFLIALFTISTYPSDGKVFYFLMDIIVLGYLCACNFWSTNIIIGLHTSYNNMKIK